MRGWLRGINNIDSSLAATGETDLFSYRISYNTTDAYGHSAPISTTALYNGNISQVHWKSKADNVKRSYSYSYDAMNRLNNAAFTTATAPNTSPSAHLRYNGGGISYDKNGNILSLERRGLTATSGTTDTFGVMDKLTYTYGQYTNRLDKVKDDAPASAITGFTDGVDTALEYSYDANGNMVKDLNKKIGTASTNGITYNYLNLPLTITIDDASTLKKIEYVYDAVGTKLKKTVTTGTNTDVTEYDSGFVFNKVNTAANKLQFFATEEGYATQDSNTADIKYTYQYKDHLGNVRLSYTDTNGNNAIVASEVIEESNYYPFGLQHGGYNKNFNVQNGNSLAQKWKYNDTEYNESFSLNMYEMPLRSYDPALARWTTIDPIVHYSNSTYNGFDNNPVFWADPSGGDVKIGDDYMTANGVDAAAAYGAVLSFLDTGEGSFTAAGTIEIDPYGGGTSTNLSNGFNNIKIGGYNPTFRERIARSVNYTNPTGLLINALQDLMSILSGQERHKYGPDAVILTKSVEGGAILGGAAGAGFILVLRGNQTGMYALGDYGVGLSGVSISTGFVAQAVYYSGDIKNIKAQTFAGERTSLSVGGDALASLGVNFTYAKGNDGTKVYGIGMAAGIGASMTIFDFNLNWGNTIIKP